jgi:SAM-dependent methyltransferase
MGYLSRVFEATERANYRAFLDMLPAGGGGRLLDIGAHEGGFTVAIAERLGTGDVHAVELIPAHAEVARRLGFDVVETDADQGLPFGDESFDVVTANQVIEHVRRTDVMLSEIRRVMRPDAVAVIGTNNMASWHNVISLAAGWQPPPQHVSDEVIVGNPLNPQDGWDHEDLGRTHLRLFTLRALRELAAYHGLKTVGARTVGFYPLPPGLGRLVSRVDRLHGAFSLLVLTRDSSSRPSGAA